MGVRNSTTEKKTFIFDSVSGRPVNTEAFDDEGTADRFIEFVEDATLRDIRTIDSLALGRLRDEFNKMEEPE